jgi:hypothetical protein
VGTQQGEVGPTEQALTDHRPQPRWGVVVGLVFGAFGECSQSVDLLVESFIGEQGYAERGYRTPEVGVGVATWAIRREWSMAHWRESANLMWWNLEHVTGTYSEHAKTKRCVQRRGATRTVQRGRTARTAPAASVVTRRCDGPAGRGCEQDLWFVPQTAVQATPFTPRRALEQPIRPGAVITLGQATASAGTS